MLGEWVAEVASSGNLVVLRTPPGCAHVVASALDRSGLDGLLGTVAGDDTLLCVAEPGTRGTVLADRLRALAGLDGAPRPATMSATDDGEPVRHGVGRRGHALARSLRRGAGRRADGVHRQPLVRPDLWRDDIAGSRAHVAGLAHVGLIEPVERDAVLAALDVTADEMGAGTFTFVPTDEDIHTAVERRVTELAGAAGAKLHTARSRNDQVATDLRLWCKRELAGWRAASSTSSTSCWRAPSEAGDIYLPGYTHLQRAQPVLLAHHLLAHGWALARDVDRLAGHRRAARRVAARGRRAGRHVVADRPGLHGRRRSGSPARSTTRSTPSATATSSPRRCSTWPCSASTSSRIGEEWVLWTSEEFGFARLDDAYATGSSMLPQKKNPDIAELARGKAGRLIGNLTGLLATLKGLPLAYNRDLQEDKEPLFDSVDQVSLALVALGGMIATATFVPERMAEAADAESSAATDLAEWLVRPRDAVPRRPRRRRRARASSPRRRARRCAELAAADPPSGRRPPRSSAPACRSAGARRRARAGRRRSPPSSRRSAVVLVRDAQRVHAS